MNAFALPVPPGLVTATATKPATPDGVVQVIVVPLTTDTPVAATPPNVTDEIGATKFVPVIVTAVPPDVGPAFGEQLVTVGAA